MTDSDMIRLYFSRDEQAIAETQKKYGKYCMTIARDIVGCEQDAEECVSDVYLKVWNSIPPEQPHSLKAYIAVLTRRIAINELSACVAVQEEDASELTALINEFLGQLSERDCRLFVRRYWYAMMPAELAGKEGMTVNAVTVRLYKLRNQLRKFLEERGYQV